jgi:hypothetical protein
MSVPRLTGCYQPDEIEIHFAMLEDCAKTPRKFDSLDLAETFGMDHTWFSTAMKKMSAMLELAASVGVDELDFVAARQILFFCQQRRIDQERFQRAAKIIHDDYRKKYKMNDDGARIDTFGKLRLYLSAHEKETSRRQNATTVLAPHEQIEQID